MSKALPSLEQVESLLAGLLGDVGVSQVETAVPADAEHIVAIYTGDDGQPAGVITTDLPFANGAGAALTMIPPGTVEQANKANEVPENIYENLQEVFNICVNLFTSQGDAHLVLKQVGTPSQPAPEEVSVENVAASSTFAIDIPRYGKGTLTLATLSA